MQERFERMEVEGKAKQAWFNYKEAIRKKFNFKDGALENTDKFLLELSKANENDILNFAEYLQGKTSELK
jgi:hypothetical protein